MIRCVLPAVLLVAGIVPARADDERLVNRVYSPDDVVRINGRIGVQATIGFGDKEAIENVAVGDAQSWQITPNKRADLLFVKPLTANARTNMTVVTTQRTYFFDLVASPSAKPLYMLRFTYNDGAKPGSASATLTEAEQQALSGGIAAPPADPAFLNFAWRQKGDTGLQPARVYDDGQSTYLVWGARQEVPAILILNDKGEEGAVNYAVRGDSMVIDEVPDKIVLRIGKRMATLDNLRPAAAPSPALASSERLAGMEPSPTQSESQ